MRALHLNKLNVDQLRGLSDHYRTTRDVRIHTRVQMILLLAEQGLAIFEVAAIVLDSGETVRLYQPSRLSGRIDLLRDAVPPKIGALSSTAALPHMTADWARRTAPAP